MIFVDTSGWFASIVPTDKNHGAARNWLLRNQEPLFTTDYVVDETLTLLKTGGETSRALQIADKFFKGKLAKIYFLTKEDVWQTCEIFQSYSDKDWSFTDCSNKFICEMFGHTHAFSFNRNLWQFSSIIVVP